LWRCKRRDRVIVPAPAGRFKRPSALFKTLSQRHYWGMDEDKRTTAEPTPKPAPQTTPPDAQKEIGGPKGPEPTRYGDWEQNGRCTDF
jgi:hypothetical protein